MNQRTIKFRAWGIETEAMFSWENVQRIDHWWDHGDLILMQFTGYEDGDSTEAYEEDIVELESARALIVWGDNGFTFEPVNVEEWCDDWNFCDDFHRFKVIGNSFENPDLLTPSTNEQH